MKTITRIDETPTRNILTGIIVNNEFAKAILPMLTERYTKNLRD